MVDPLPPRLDPKTYETRWQEAWERAGLFQAPRRTLPGAHFTVVLPPPNLTGILTLGHSLGGTCMDILVRHHRMLGEPTLWLPGVDHAGLATQMAVRRHLESQGVPVTGFDREDWQRAVEAWRVEKERHIRRQWAAHGFSLDHSRYVYTLDPRYSRAVRHAFVRLFREGRIYRAERMVNWDPVAQTALSDLEVVPTEVRGTLYYVRYPAAGTDPERKEGLVVATTRPETLFGDVAVAVNPADERHRGWVGRSVRLPLTDRTLPVILDEAVDMTFGNGALKVTPSHDPADLAIAQRHPELPARREVLDAQARMTGPYVPAPFQGLSREEARRRTVEALRAEGYLVREEVHDHRVGYSERSEVPVEPRLSLQWFVDVRPMAGPALAAEEHGDLTLVPERWRKTYRHFLSNLEPWCISRQVAWGHPIPVFTCGTCGWVDACEEDPSACPQCGGSTLRRDPDVLDTWFSSWLWPFATLGWPEETPDRIAYFPVSVLVTGSDILFFWVARMVMGAQTFLGELPFPRVYLTGILRDPEGRKLSKHLGNSPDPLELIETWGADAFRFGLVFPLPTEEGGTWDPQKASEGGRNFLTKVWNLGRMLQGSLPPDLPPPREAPVLGEDDPLLDRWVLSRYSATVRDVRGALEALEITRAAGALHHFLWHEVADWWLEGSKGRLSGKEGDAAWRQAAGVGLHVMEGSLRLLHPFVPHMTEELWHALPHEGEFLATAPVPCPGPEDRDAEALANELRGWVEGIRTLRGEVHLPAELRPPAYLRPHTEAGRSLGQRTREHGVIVRLARVASLRVLGEGDAPPPGAFSLVTPAGEIYLGRPERTEASSEEALRKERDRVQDWLSKARSRIADPTFRERAPAAVVAETEAKVRELSERLRLLGEHLGEAHD
jgi:valyl-tRNA synthetase